VTLTLGKERWKIGLLAGLVLIAVYFLFFSNSDDKRARNRATAVQAVPVTPANPTPRATAAAGRSSNPAPPNITRAAARGNSRSSAGGAEFKPSLKPKRPEDVPDPMTVDPTLRLDVLAKVQRVNVEGGQRSLFDFSTPPPPKPTGPPEAKIHAKPSPLGAAAAPGSSSATSTPLTPAAPPIPLKFYGYQSPMRQGAKRAFFLSGDDIFVASEGDMIQKRYKVVRIGVNSVVMEDTQSKSQQTLPLEAQPG
jgi:hypothetical protein